MTAANTGYVIAAMKTKIERLESNQRELILALKAYMHEYPAFRSKPIGAPNSSARAEQNTKIGLEDLTRETVKKIEAQS